MTAAPNSEEAEVLVGHFLAWLSSGEKTYPLNDTDKPTFWKFLQKVMASFYFWRNESIPLFYGFYQSYIFFHYITELGSSSSPYGSISL